METRHLAGRRATGAGGFSSLSRLRVWLQAVRIFSFTASVVPILVASALAVEAGTFDPLLAVAMLVASVACHAGANLANDYYDHLKGIDTPESLGPSKVVQQGLLTPNEIRRGMLVAFALATVIGLGIVAATGWPVLALALVSLAADYLYTGGPKPLGYVALGELTVFLTMGIGMVVGAYYVLAGGVTVPVLLAALPIACLVAAILHANNVRDIDLDRTAEKRTLATLLGRHAANLVAVSPDLWPALLTLVTAPLAIRVVVLVWTAGDPPTLNVALRRTAGLHLRYGLLLTAGLLIAALLDR